MSQILLMWNLEKEDDLQLESIDKLPVKHVWFLNLKVKTHERIHIILLVSISIEPSKASAESDPAFLDVENPNLFRNG